VSAEVRTIVTEHRQKLRPTHRLPIGRSSSELRTREPQVVERDSGPRCFCIHSTWGAEFILRAISDAFDGGVSKRGDWHSALLSSMVQPTPNRPAVLTSSTATALRPYMLSAIVSGTSTTSSSGGPPMSPW